MAKRAGQLIQADQNTFPFDLPDAAREVLSRASVRVSDYPEPRSRALAESIAAEIEVPPDHIVVGNGSAALLRHLCRATLNEGDCVIVARPGYGGFFEAVERAGARVRPVALVDAGVDVAAMLAEQDAETRGFYVANPHNPTGTVVDRSDLERLVAEREPGSLVIVDEAYHEFAEPALIPDARRLYWSRPDVVVTRTFSKLYGLAGLRIAYLVTEPELATTIRAEMDPYGVTSTSQEVAASLIGRQDLVAERRRAIADERTYVMNGLSTISGVLDALTSGPVPESHANFVWLPVGGHADELAARLRARNIAVKAFAGQGVRISLGTRASNRRMLRALRAALHDLRGP